MYANLGEARTALHYRILEVDDIASQHPPARLNWAINEALQHVCSEFHALQLTRDFTAGPSAYSWDATFRVVINNVTYTFSLVELSWASWWYDTAPEVVYQLVPVEAQGIEAQHALTTSPIRAVPHYIFHHRFMLVVGGGGAPPQDLLVLSPAPAQDITVRYMASYLHPVLSQDVDLVFVPNDFKDAVLDFALAKIYEATDTNPRVHLWELGTRKAQKAQYAQYSRTSWAISQRLVRKDRSI